MKTIIHFLSKMQEIVQLKKSPIFESNKAQLMAVVDQYAQEIAFNGGDPLKDLVLCRKFSFLLEKMEDALKGAVIRELSNHDNSETTLMDCSIKEVESGVKYDFTNSEAWVVQKKIVDEATAKLKEIEAFAKGCRSETTILDEDTGEMIKYYPPVKTSTTSLRVTLK